MSQSLRSLQFLLSYQREQMAGPRSTAKKRAQKTKNAAASRLVCPEQHALMAPHHGSLLNNANRWPS